MNKQSTIRRVGSAVLLLLVAAITGGAKSASAKQTISQQQQQQQQRQQQQGNTRVPSLDDNKDGNPPDPFKIRMEEQASKARNSDRHKRIVADTDKLLQLSTELKADVDKTTKNEMSLDVIRKAEQIEKLAHDVKERMKS